MDSGTSLIALEDDQLDGVAGGNWQPGAALQLLKGLNIGPINIDIDINTQINIINFIGNTIQANGPVAIELGQQAQAQG